MRLGKPMEHLQAALKATLSKGPVGEAVTTIARQLCYFGYLSFDAIVWVSRHQLLLFTIPISVPQAQTIKLINLSPDGAKKVAKTAFRFWFAGISFSLVHGILKVSFVEPYPARRLITPPKSVRLSQEKRALVKSKAWGEKDLAEEAARETRLNAIEA